jgi:hypothetical protein
MIIGTAMNGGWFSGLSEKVFPYIKVKSTDFTPGRSIAFHPMGKRRTRKQQTKIWI